MNIEATGYIIKLSEQELFDLVHSLKHELEDEGKITHASHWDGIDTYIENYGPRLEMYSRMCSSMGRADLYNETMKVVEEGIKKLQEAKK